ncbi:MAG TPA: hypothetical protein VH253_03115 [Phycisphaerae bacterium]|nr:hypothetical protein [Phycisphaerae bacterium]
MPVVGPSSVPASVPAGSHPAALHHGAPATPPAVENLLTFLAILAFTLVFVWAFYAVKRRLQARGRRELGLAEAHAEAMRAGGAVRMPPTSLVLLSRTARPLSRELVGEAVRRAWGVEELSEDENDDAHWVFGQTEQLATLSVEGTVFTVVSLAEPYKNDREWYVSEETGGELLDAWRQHRAWVSVDVAALGHMVTVNDALDRVGKLAAELADGQTLAVVRPAARHAVVFDEELRQLLRARPAREVVSGAPASLVILQRERRALDSMGSKGLAEHVKRAWNVELPIVPASAAADFCAVSSEGGGTAYIQHRGIRLGITSPEGAYTREVDAALADPALRDALGAHRAWWAVDMMAAPVGAAKADVYGLIAKLTATLIDENALLVIAPALRRAYAVTPGLLETLRSEDPLPGLQGGA